QAPKKAKRRQAAEGGSSNVFSMFEQSQIQEYKEAFTVIDQNRDGIISKDDLRDTLAAMGADPEDAIMAAFKVLDPEATGTIKKDL
ncbi:UNVERIFIED_CONTAM: hypothetical protein FKN15_026943, partial [Acipenser sinensis]